MMRGGEAKPAMIHGGVPKPAMDRGGVHVSMASQVAATWRFNPATMHGGVQWFCPAMHDDGAKRLRFENFLGSGIFFKFVLKMD